MPRLSKPYKRTIEYSDACRPIGILVPPLHPDPEGAISAVQELHAKSRATLQRRAAPADAVSEKLAQLASGLSEADTWVLLQQLEPLGALPARTRAKAVAAILAASALPDLDAAIVRFAKKR